MRRVWLIGGMVVAIAGLEAGTTGMAMANNAQGFDALENFSPGSEEGRNLLQMSDMELGSVVGGDASNPLETMRVSLDDALTRQVNQILTQALTGQRGNQSVTSTNESNTNVEQGGRDVTVQQTQTSTQSNGPQRTNNNNQLNSLQEALHVTVKSQADGTTRVVIQQGVQTSTIIVPFTISSHTLLNSIPFQALVSVGQNVVQGIHELSGPVLGNPSSLLRRH